MTGITRIKELSYHLHVLMGRYNFHALSLDALSAKISRPVQAFGTENILAHRQSDPDPTPQSNSA